MSKKDPNWKNICMNCNFEHPRSYTQRFCSNCKKTRKYIESDESFIQRKKEEEADQKSLEQTRKNIDKYNREVEATKIFGVLFIIFIVLFLIGLIFSGIYYPMGTAIFIAIILQFIIYYKLLGAFSKYI